MAKKSRKRSWKKWVPGRRSVVVNGKGRAMDDCGSGQQIPFNDAELSDAPLSGARASNHIPTIPTDDGFILDEDDGVTPLDKIFK